MQEGDFDFLVCLAIETAGSVNVAGERSAGEVILFDW